MRPGYLEKSANTENAVCRSTPLIGSPDHVFDEETTMARRIVSSSWVVEEDAMVADWSTRNLADVTPIALFRYIERQALLTELLVVEVVHDLMVTGHFTVVVVQVRTVLCILW